MRTPEAEARRIIDELLTAAGWVVQDYARRNPAAARGVAIREFPLTTGAADYLLLVDRRPIGVVEARKVGFPLVGVEPQAAKYSVGSRAPMTHWREGCARVPTAAGWPVRLPTPSFGTLGPYARLSYHCLGPVGLMSGQAPFFNPPNGTVYNVRSYRAPQCRSPEFGQLDVTDTRGVYQ